MATIWNEARRRELQQRIAALTPERHAQWGRMTAPQMICHLADSLKMAIGDLPVASKRLPIRYPPLKQLIIYALPFPKSAPTAPELLARTPREWRADVGELHALMNTFAARRGSPSWPEHPAFGALSERAWGVLVYRHMDHHLRQFGA